MTKPGERVYAVLSATPEEVSLLGFGVYVGDEVPPAPVGFVRAVFRASTWEEFDRVVAEDAGCEPDPAARPRNPKIVLDDGQVVWGAECWWGPESTYASFRGERAEKRCSIAAEQEAPVEAAIAGPALCKQCGHSPCPHCGTWCDRVIPGTQLLCCDGRCIYPGDPGAERVTLTDWPSSEER